MTPLPMLNIIGPASCMIFMPKVHCSRDGGVNSVRTEEIFFDFGSRPREEICTGGRVTGYGRLRRDAAVLQTARKAAAVSARGPYSSGNYIVWGFINSPFSAPFIASYSASNILYDEN